MTALGGMDFPVGVPAGKMRDRFGGAGFSGAAKRYSNGTHSRLG